MRSSKNKRNRRCSSVRNRSPSILPKCQSAVCRTRKTPDPLGLGWVTPSSSICPAISRAQRCESHRRDARIFAFCHLDNWFSMSTTMTLRGIGHTSCARNPRGRWRPERRPSARGISLSPVTGSLIKLSPRQFTVLYCCLNCKCDNQVIHDTRTHEGNCADFKQQWPHSVTGGGPPVSWNRQGGQGGIRILG